MEQRVVAATRSGLIVVMAHRIERVGGGGGRGHMRGNEGMEDLSNVAIMVNSGVESKGLVVEVGEREVGEARWFLCIYKHQ